MPTTLAFGVIIDVTHESAAAALTLAADNPAELGTVYATDARAFVYSEEGSSYVENEGDVARPAQFSMGRPGKLYTPLYPIIEAAGGSVIDSGLLLVQS